MYDDVHREKEAVFWAGGETYRFSYHCNLRFINIKSAFQEEVEDKLSNANPSKSSRDKSNVNLMTSSGHELTRERKQRLQKGGTFLLTHTK